MGGGLVLVPEGEQTPGQAQGPRLRLTPPLVPTPCHSPCATSTPVFPRPPTPPLVPTPVARFIAPMKDPMPTNASQTGAYAGVPSQAHRRGMVARRLFRARSV